MKRPGFNSKRVVMVQAHYENGRYVPPVYVGDRSLATPVSARDHLANGWKTLNRPKEIYLGASRGVKVLLLVMLIVMGILVTDQSLKTPSIHGLTGGTSYFDPFNTLYNETFTSGDLSGFSCNRATYITSPARGFNLTATSSGPAICLTKSPLDLSPASGKLLRFNFGFSVANMKTNAEFGWFLTRNATLIGIGPDNNYSGSGSAYNPWLDHSVALYHQNVLTGAGTGNGNILSQLLIQRDPSAPINGQAYDSCLGGSTQGVCWITGTMNTCGFGCLPLPPRTGIGSELNFTGKACTSCASTGYSDLYVEAAGNPNIVKAPGIPPFQFQAVSYYLGFFVTKGSGNTEQFVLPDNCAGQSGACWSIDFGEYQVAAPVLPPANIDTGGFFGPVIKALISIGIFILASIAQFLGYVYNAFINGLDVVGRFLGLGAVGSAFAGALKGFADWIINIFGNIFLQSLNFVNFITSGLTLMVNGVSNYWAGATAFIGQLVDLLSQGWTFVTSTLKFGNLGIRWLVVVWLVFGIMETANSLDGFMRWFTISMLFTVKLFHGLYWIGDQAFLTVLRAKQLIAQWL